MAKTVLLLNDTDCNSLQENGDFQIVNPVNGPDGATNILISVTAPGQAIRPDNVSQKATSLPTGAQFERRFVPGTGWEAWADAASGGGGGGGTAEEMAISSGFKTVWGIAFSSVENTPALIADFDTLQAALVPGVVSGPADTLNAQLGCFLYAMTNMLSTMGQRIVGSADPTANDDGANTSGLGKMLIGAVWVNFSSGDAFICVDNTSAAAVWKKITFAA